MPKLATRKSLQRTTKDKVRSSSATSVPLRKVRIVSLFSGAGGLEIAACRTGMVEAIVSTDSNATFLSTVERNMPVHFSEVRHASIVSDAREIKGATLKKMLGAAPDVVMGGPPCDDYTQFGNRRGIGGKKGPLIFEYLRLVHELDPQCFVFENVPNLTRQFKGVFELFLARAKELHYCTKWVLLKACDFGAPTQRTRVFVVGWKSDRIGQAFRFPEPTYGDPSESGLFTQPGGIVLPFCLVRDVLSNLPDVNTVAAKDFLNHTGRNHRPKTIEHMKTIKMGQAVTQSFRYRVPWEGLARSLTAGVDHATKSYLHPHFHREMSVREYARLHLFPDSWLFSGNHHNGIKQVANAVPIPLGEVVLTSVFKLLMLRAGRVAAVLKKST